MILKRARITGRGQLQLPVEIRKNMGAAVGDEILFKMHDDGGVSIELVKKQKYSDFAGVLPVKRDFPGINTEEESVRQKVAEKRGQYRSAED